MNRVEVYVGAFVIALSLYYLVQEIRSIRSEMDIQTTSIIEGAKDIRKLQKKWDDLIKELYASRITRELERYNEEEKKLERTDDTYIKENIWAEAQPHTGLPPNAVLHPLRSPASKSSILYCQEMQLDGNSTDTNWIHIAKGGELVNRPEPNNLLNRFKQYGRVRTKFSLASHGHPVYWELKVKVTLAAPLQDGDVVMTTGLCIEDTCDAIKYEFILEYGSSLMMRRVESGSKTLLRYHTLDNHAGSTETFSYGVIIDRSLGNIGILSLDEPFECYSEEFEYTSRPIWPVINVNTADKLLISVKLVVGRDIEMTEHTKNLILKTLGKAN